MTPMTRQFALWAVLIVFVSGCGPYFRTSEQKVVIVVATPVGQPTAGLGLQAFQGKTCDGTQISSILLTNQLGRAEFRRPIKQGKYAVLLDSITLCYYKEGDFISIWSKTGDPSERLELRCVGDTAENLTCSETR